MSKKSIGVFDSGLGGLTAVRELHRLAPDEDIIYLGDTARVPYGARSAETVTRFARQALNRLRSMDVRAIVVACGTVSSVCLPDLAAEYDVPLFGVVEPASALASTLSNGNIGVIATPATIRSGAYERTLAALTPAATVFSRACPLFVPLAENGYTSAADPVVKAVVADALAELKASPIDTLILGCTHYPLLRDAIAAEMGAAVTLIDVGAAAAKAALAAAGSVSGSGSITCYVTDTPQDFSASASRFLGKDFASQVVKIELN